MGKDTPIEKNYSEKAAGANTKRFRARCMAEMPSVGWGHLTEEFMNETAAKFGRQAECMQDQINRGRVVERDDVLAKRLRGASSSTAPALVDIDSGPLKEITGFSSSHAVTVAHCSNAPLL